MKHLKEFVKSVPDYRRTERGNYKYKLEDILLLVNDLITDSEKWNGNLTVIEIRTATERKSDGQKSSERRFYVSSFHGSARQMGTITRMHWDLDRNLRQDFIRRKNARPVRNFDTIQRMVLAILSIWKGKRKKLSDKAKGTAELIGELSMNFTAMMHMLAQK